MAKKSQVESEPAALSQEAHWRVRPRKNTPSREAVLIAQADWPNKPAKNKVDFLVRWC